MTDGKKKLALFSLIVLAAVILLAVGSSFAYFSISLSSAENALDLRAAEFSLRLEEDISLIKNNLIPTAERFVDIASTRVDQNGDFIKPYEDPNTGETVTADTVCIDDNLYEICSIYTFTLYNDMTDADLPLYITLDPVVNSFDNLYFKVLDSSMNEVISATHLVDDRPYEMDGDNKVYTEGSTISPVVLTNINTTLNRAVNSSTPTTVTYSIVMWIMETGGNQNGTDGNKLFAATLNVKAGGVNNKITGVMSTNGTE